MLKAQQVLCRAFRTDVFEHDERVRIAEEALQISSLCADAWNILAEHKATTYERALKFYKKGEEAGIKAINDPNYEAIIK